MDATPQIDPQVLLAQTGWVRGLAHRLVQDEHAADDVVQDTWVAALEGAPSEERGLRAWLAVVARNLALKRNRRELARGDVERSAALPERGRVQEGDLDRLRLHQRLVEAVLELDEPYRSTIVARYFDGLAPQTIARAAHVSPAAVRQRCARGLRMLRARLDREFDGDRGAWCVALGPLAAGGGARASGWSLLAGSVGGGLGGSVMASKLALGGLALLGAAALSVSLWPDDPAPERDAALEPSVAAAEGGGLREAPSDAVLPAVVEGTAARAPVPEGTVPGAGAGLAQLEGEVLDAAGAPLPGAWIRSAGEPPAEAHSDETGRFVLRLKPPSDERAGIALQVGCDGHAPVEIEATPGRPVSVRLLELPRVVGRVVDAGGHPVDPPGRVVLHVLPAPEEPVELALGAGGVFAAEGLPRGELRGASAVVRGHPEAELQCDRALVAGEVLELELVVPRGAVVTGTVLDEITRRPVGGASVWADAGDFDPDSLRPTAVTDAAGRFELRGVKADPRFPVSDDGEAREFVVVWVMASAPGYAPTPTRAFGAARNDEERYSFEITMTRSGCSFGGRVVDRSGEEPVELAHVHGVDSQGNYRFTQTDREGRFEFAELPVGSFGLLARHGELGDADGGAAVYAELELEVGVHQDLRLRLGAGTCAIRGRIDAGPGGWPYDTPAQVVASFAFQHGGLAVSVDSRTVEVQSDGQFAIEGLPPGRYDVALQGLGARAGVHGLDFGSGRRTCVAPDAHAFELVEGEQRGDVDFRLGPCVTFGGRVLLEAGAPAAALRDVRAELWPAGGVGEAAGGDGGGLAERELDSEGAFSFGRVLAGVYELRLTRAGRVLSRTEVGPGSADSLLLTLE